MINDLIKYLKKIRLLVDNIGFESDFLRQELIRISIENWVNNERPNLTKKQVKRAILKSIANRKINLN
jgi:hypothetical protein